MLPIIAFFRIALSIIFALAGFTKLFDQSGTREAVRNFGAPPPLVPPLALILPFVELAVAAGLLFTATVWASSIAALLLLGLFIISISINLARGQKHDCHCFGQLYSRPLGWPTLVRNGVFAFMAALIFWWERRQPGNSIGETLTQLSAWQWLTAIGLVVVIAVVITLWQRRTPKAAEDEWVPPTPLPVDAAAPTFDLIAYDGGRQSLQQLLERGKPLLLIFTNPKCGPCIYLFKEIKDWQDAHDDHLTIAVITTGTIKDNFVNVARNRLGQVLLQEQREIAQEYRALVTPTGVLVSTQGRIASLPAAGAGEIRALLDGVVGNGDRQ